MSVRKGFSLPPDQRIPVLRLISRLNIGGTAIHTILLTEGM